MAFFNGRKKTNNTTLKVKDVKVATTIITSSYNDRSGAGPKCVKWYFLVYEEKGKYYEIFSHKQIEKESDTHHDGVGSQYFDTPYIEKLEPLTEYLEDKNKKVIELQLLFDFILNMNLYERLGAFDGCKD